MSIRRVSNDEGPAPRGEPGPRPSRGDRDYFWKIAKPQKQGFVLHAAIVTFTL